MKKLGIIRIALQILFIILTIAGIKLTPMGTSKFITFGLIFVFGAFYCSWVCAFGSIQEYIRKFGKKYINKTLIIPPNINRILLYFRYIPIFLMLLYITRVFDKITELTDGRKTFLSLISGKTISITLILIMISFLILSLFIDRPFCKYFCQEGARYGIFGMSRLVMLARDKETCINCGLCTKNCQMGLEVANKKRVNEPHCISCGDCLQACPKEGALKLKFRSFKDPINIVLFLIGSYMGYKMITHVLSRLAK